MTDTYHPFAPISPCAPPDEPIALAERGNGDVCVIGRERVKLGGSDGQGFQFRNVLLRIEGEWFAVDLLGLLEHARAHPRGVF